MASTTPVYNYTVHSLLRDAGRQRSTANCRSEIDHVVELQLVVAALNAVTTAFRRPGWQAELFDFFNHRRNLECIPRYENQEKGRIVSKFIRGYPLTEQEKECIRKITERWNMIKGQLKKFYGFKKALTGLLSDVNQAAEDRRARSHGISTTTPTGPCCSSVFINIW